MNLGVRWVKWRRSESTITNHRFSLNITDSSKRDFVSPESQALCGDLSCSDNRTPEELWKGSVPCEHSINVYHYQSLLTVILINYSEHVAFKALKSSLIIFSFLCLLYEHRSACMRQPVCRSVDMVWGLLLFLYHVGPGMESGGIRISEIPFSMEQSGESSVLLKR